ncbi:MAG: DUF6364 family protein [Bacteroidota bacterium]|nr:DUF6364 family protein [Bacteroidota bacterium]
MAAKAGTSKERPKRSKLTLSVRAEHVALLRKASARKGRSISELVEELAEKLNEEPEIGDRGAAFIKRHLGVLAGKVKQEDHERDDRIGDILRKHAPQ